ncbi:MAG: hypothetical protein HZC13_04655 [Nitrospirae bacterium]|nr:hypothetical protein [Nitrospirota bacterium]
MVIHSGTKGRVGHGERELFWRRSLYHADDIPLMEPDVYLVPLLDIGSGLYDGAAWQLAGDLLSI